MNLQRTEIRTRSLRVGQAGPSPDYLDRFVTVRHYALHGLSYRNSVCPSVTVVECVHRVQPTIIIFSPYGSPTILVSADITFISKFEGGHPERGR